jgi:hypothetical protein
VSYVGWGCNTQNSRIDKNQSIYQIQKISLMTYVFVLLSLFIADYVTLHIKYLAVFECYVSSTLVGVEIGDGICSVADMQSTHLFF